MLESLVGGVKDITGIGSYLIKSAKTAAEYVTEKSNSISTAEILHKAYNTLGDTENSNSLIIPGWIVYGLPVLLVVGVTGAGLYCVYKYRKSSREKNS